MTDEETVAHGLRAFDEYRELGGVFDKLEAGIFQALKETPIGASDKVLNLHKTLAVAKDVRAALREMIDNGLVAKAALEAASAKPD